MSRAILVGSAVFPSIMEDLEVDIAIIGAGKSYGIPVDTQRRIFLTNNCHSKGLSGIAFARFYLGTHPKCRLAIFEKDGCIGGVWSRGSPFPKPFSNRFSVDRLTYPS